MSREVDTLDPRDSTDAHALRATRLIHAGLVALDPSTLAPVPCAAKSWEWKDARTLRVELRDDVRFHSGKALAPEDVVATLRAFAKSRHASVVDAIAGAEPDGPHAVIVRLSRAHATLLTDLEVPLLRADQAMGPPDPRGEMDGLGPFQVSRVEPGVVELVPAEHSVLPKPTHAVTLRAVRDENARAMRLHAGRADVATNEISPTLLPALADVPGLAIVSRPGANLTYLVVREGRGPLADVRVRRAISFAVDRDAITSALFGGHAHPASGLIPEGHWAAPRTPLPVLARDTREAERLLDDAGYPMRGGEPRIELTLLVSTDRLRVSIARVLAQELAEVGVAVDVVSLDLGVVRDRLRNGDFDLVTLTLPELTEPHIFRQMLHSAFVPPNGTNRGRVADPLLDALLEQGGSENDREVRRDIYAKVAVRVVEEMHIVPLWHEDQVAVVSDRARGFLPSAEGRWGMLARLPE